MIIWLSLSGLIIFIAYLLGSIPTGYIAVKAIKGIDIRDIGSGSTGATNVLRTLGKGSGAFVLGIDCLKGLLAIYCTYAWFHFALNNDLLPINLDIQLWQQWLVNISGVAAILGHSKSLFLGFTGGKSVATSLGILLAINWQVALATIGIFILILAIFRIVSLSSICSAITVPLAMVSIRQPLAYIIFSVIGGLYVIWRHKSNIQRLLLGTEAKLGQVVRIETSE
ncbi:Acyl-phosphate:glycerol-3-phosphate O-acyltransferase PlsY [Richelia intracellularis HM01]|uniref:glycerol-3-phosphate 1-O-acyltransferase PlsY n=1 Tax=Richelia intracellularis TaxID=1164990 RepID=UPI0002B5F47E|nr:glycerol-3-phosphate 1-O-acyltransferase PlsY [Richelia intracellularis]CCH65354.1 Acyl-phosphate:glycerol-3-phosphate O-acyltransferase PlsY [Richelia intracellularis HM01]